MNKRRSIDRSKGLFRAHCSLHCISNLHAAIKNAIPILPALILIAFNASASNLTQTQQAQQAQLSKSDRINEQTSPDFSGDVPKYAEEARSAGITHRYEGAWEYFVGGGVSSFDCNQDRMPDLFIAGGENEARLFVNRSEVTGKLKFEPVTNASLSMAGVLGSYPIDIDNDNHMDLVVLRAGENFVFQGGPDCQFKPANARWNFDGGNAWTTAFSATFEPGHTYPTLAIGNYVDRAAPGSPWGTCHDNELHRPANSESPSYADMQPLSPGYCALSMVFTDWTLQKGSPHGPIKYGIQGIDGLGVDAGPSARALIL